MYEIYGNENAVKTIIAIPALGERKEMFHPLANKLAEFKWIAFDLPGTNKEQQESYAIDSFCQTIYQTMQKLNIVSAHFVGNSIGAWVIQAFASMFQDNVESLIFLDGGHYFLGELDNAYEYTELLSGVEDFEDIRLAVKEFTYSMPNLAQENYEWFEYYFIGNYISLENGYAHHCEEIAYNALSKEVSSVNYCLNEIPYPTLLVIAGASASEYSIQQAQLFSKQNYENVAVRIIQNGQHYLPLTNTRDVANSMLDFYKSME